MDQRKLKNDILEAANNKDAKQCYTLFETYTRQANKIENNIISSVIRSFTKKKDEKYLTAVLDVVQKKNIKLGESEYKSIDFPNG